MRSIVVCRSYLWQRYQIENSLRSGSGGDQKHPRFLISSQQQDLVPIYSASGVDCCFSQVMFIIEAVGEGVLEETLETRVVERINNYHS